VWIQSGGFDQGADATQQRQAVGVQRRTQQVDFAAIRAEQAQQQADRRCLAGTIRTEEAVDAGGWNVQVESVDGHDRTEAAAKAVRVDRKWRHHTS
jgi:transposase-like protein